jgi:hypothetical protein
MLNFDSVLVDYYKNLPHNFSYYETDMVKRMSVHLAKFIEDTRDVPFFRQIIERCRKATPNGTDDETLPLLVAFVQGALQYDYEKLTDRSIPTRYPYETVLYGRGVCIDKTILLGEIFNALNYNHVYLLYEKQNHIAIGIKVPHGYQNYMYNGTPYAFIESTNYFPIGYIPKDNAHQKMEKEAPVFVPPLNNGLKQYSKIIEDKKKMVDDEAKFGKGYIFGNYKQKKCLEKKHNLMLKLHAVEKRMLEMKKEYFNHDASKVNAYNGLVKEYNQIAALIRAEVDMYNSFVK